MMSAFSALAFARISAHGTITPMLTTSKLLHCRTTDDDVLADVVHVALHGRDHDLALRLGDDAGARFFRRLFCLDERDQVRHRLLHHARRSSPPAAGTSCPGRTGRRRRSCRPSAGLRSPGSGGRLRASIFWRASSVSSTIHCVMPCTSACARRFSTGALRHSRFCFLLAPPAFSVPANSIMRSVASGAAVQHHVLDALAQFGRDVVVHADHAGVDDAHGHAGLDRVVQEHGVDRLARRVVAAEREATRSTRRPRSSRAAGSRGSSAWR